MSTQKKLVDTAKAYKIKPLPTDYIDKFLTINPKNGKITRNDRSGGEGSLDKDGYLILKIKGAQFKAHRIAYYMYHKVDPVGLIDHKDGDRVNNSIDNLVIVTQLENNNHNRRAKNKDTGVVGVYMDKTTKGLRAKYSTKHKGKQYRFRNLSDAVEFRRSKGLTI